MQMWQTDDVLPVKPMAQYLKDVGYKTACFGKTHWYISEYDIPIEDSGVKPTRRGFDIVHEAWDRSFNHTADTVLYPEARPEYDALIKQETIVTQLGGEDVAGYVGQTSGVPGHKHPAAWLADGAIDYIKSHQDQDKSFFLYLSIDPPHAVLSCPKEFEDLYDIDDIPDTALPPPNWEVYEHTTAWRHRDAWNKLDPITKRRTTLRYYALCTYADYQFGRVLDALNESGEWDNTTIIYTSDHGESLGERYRFSKYSLYEPSVRVPMIISGCAVKPELRGTVDPRPAELVDILPTLLDLAGEAAPSWFSGGSLLAPPCREGQFSEFHGSGYHEEQYGPKYMWRAGGYKLVLHMPKKVTDAMLRLEDTIGELYDLAKDPLEIDNLYKCPDFLELRERMTRNLLMHMMICWAKYPRGMSPTKV